jgi:hypothetical protein
MRALYLSPLLAKMMNWNSRINTCGPEGHVWRRARFFTPTADAGPPAKAVMPQTSPIPMLVVGGTADPLEQAVVVRAITPRATAATARWMRMTTMLSRSRRRGSSRTHRIERPFGIEPSTEGLSQRHRTYRSTVKAFAYLTVVVLTIIAVGVSLVNGLPNLPPLRTYGSAPLRFEAAFPTSLGKVQASLPVPGLVLYAAGIDTRSAFIVEGIEPSRLSAIGTRNNGGGYTSMYLPIEKGPTTTSFAGGFKIVREAVRCGAFRLRYVQKLTAAQTESPSIAATDSLTNSTKAPHVCWLGETVSGHGLRWFVSAGASTASTAEQFVDSFKPLVASR